MSKRRVPGLWPFFISFCPPFLEQRRSAEERPGIRSSVLTTSTSITLSFPVGYLAVITPSIPTGKCAIICTVILTCDQKGALQNSFQNHYAEMSGHQMRFSLSLRVIPDTLTRQCQQPCFQVSYLSSIINVINTKHLQKNVTIKEGCEPLAMAIGVIHRGVISNKLSLKTMVRVTSGLDYRDTLYTGLPRVSASKLYH